jgi:hypothetical protein
MKPSLLGLPVPTLAASALRGATPVSEVRRRSRRAPRRFAALARASLALPLITMSSACLITDPTQFTAQQHTAPFLLEQTASPNPWLVKKIDDVDLVENPTVTFSAEVVSQDDSTFSQILTNLYIDYGYTGAPGVPYRYYLGGTPLPAATLQTTGRVVSAQWFPLDYMVSPGCHTATLVVSHIFDSNECPACTDDYSMITWQLLRCNSGMTPSDCDELPTSGPSSCLAFTSSCAQVLADAGPDASSCPEAVDGGAGGGGS